MGTFVHPSNQNDPVAPPHHHQGYTREEVKPLLHPLGPIAESWSPGTWDLPRSARRTRSESRPPDLPLLRVVRFGRLGGSRPGSGEGKAAVRRGMDVVA